MSELLDQLPQPHAYLVAGGGGGMRSTIILRMIAEGLTERGISYTAIDGIVGKGESQMVRHPSLQVEAIEADLAGRPDGTPLLFVSHCVGTVAALRTVERLDKTRRTGLVSVAPPLPSPRITIDTPQSQKKRTDGNTRMRVVDLPADAVDYSVMTESRARIDPQYFADIDAADDLEQRLRSRVEAGGAAVFSPEYDWNTESPRTIQAWHGDWSATLPPDEARALQRRAPIVYDAAHGLYISPRSELDPTAEESVKFQKVNVDNVIDTGLGLLAMQI